MTGERNEARWTIEQMRAIVEQKGFGTVQVEDRPVELDLDAFRYGADPDYTYEEAPLLGTVIVDMQTAQAIVLLYDAVGPEARQTMLRLPVERVAEVAWKCVRHG